MTVLLFITWIAMVAMYYRMSGLATSWNELYRQMIKHCDDLVAQVKAAHQETIESQEQTLAVKMELARLGGQLDVIEKGRVFDQHMVSTSIERAERFRRVLEAVLRAQGCDDEAISAVISKTEDDKPLEG